MSDLTWLLSNFIHAEIRNSSSLARLIPAYFSYNGNESIVRHLLKDKIIHHLPEGLDPLVCFLKDVELVRSNSKKGRLQVGYAGHPYNNKKEELKNAVMAAKRYHLILDRQQDIVPVIV